MAEWRSYVLADQPGALYLVNPGEISGARETMDGHAVLLLRNGSEIAVRTTAKAVMADIVLPPAPPMFVANVGADPSRATFSGVSDPNSTIVVRDGAELVVSVAADAAGTWETGGPVSLSPGTHTLVAIQTDVFGRQSKPSESCVISVPEPAPPPPPPEPTPEPAPAEPPPAEAAEVSPPAPEPEPEPASAPADMKASGEQA